MEFNLEIYNEDQLENLKISPSSCHCVGCKPTVGQYPLCLTGYEWKVFKSVRINPD